MTINCCDTVSPLRGQGEGVEEDDDPAYAGRAATNKVRQEKRLGMDII
jgi:hypothetical protein